MNLCKMRTLTYKEQSMTKVTHDKTNQSCQGVYQYCAHINWKKKQTNKKKVLDS